MTSKKRTSPGYQLYELFSSMRFAIGLLTILAIASVIGTVLKQNEPYPNYAFEFGPFWFKAFEDLGLYDVYHSAWFLTILTFLVTSTTLCIVRNGPGFVHEMRAFREKASDNSLAAMKHSQELALTLDEPAALALLQRLGMRYKRREREDGSVVLAAKKGAANKLGYFFAHIAMVVICIGGLLDGNLPLKLGELAGKIVPETRDLPQSQIPAQSRLTAANLSFRGNVTIAENKSADVIFLNSGNGYLVQDLPFIVTLKKFHVDYYSNGMPKLFASDIVVTDKQSGKETPATIKVNHPLIIDGVAIYQASFGDGGSPLQLRAWNLAAPQLAPVDIKGVSLAAQPLKANGKDYQLEFGELRVFNVENMGKAPEGAKSMGQRMQDAREVKQDSKSLKNIGPSVTFKLRDSQGQAREFMHYMAPMEQEGALYQVAGVRSEVSQPFQFLRIPLDDQLKIDSFMRLRAALNNPAWYDDIVKRTTAKALQGNAISPAMQQQFATSVRWVLARFSQGGFNALEQFLDQKVPADKRQAIAQTYIKILQGTIIDVMAVAQEKAGLAPWPQDAKHYRFLLDSLVAISGFNDYTAPVYLELSGFDQVQASGLQMTRSPGKSLVYMGSLLLVIGIILMFYIREVRLWLVLRSGRVRVAMSSNRHNRDLDRDFAQVVDTLEGRKAEGGEA
ncbi:cytochrome c biogenesis protein ResB [Vogesella sp. LIG4]|uniref:cytochrome c biogenesis protein ResB n=1 Tax=Vogesella sp. LIG4 TaxID=1192162 RepID=UPI00081FD4AD|nr:cytochrome c biogenesis protein ResB [Vogesella sp. LIG4]SCK11348.1 cytochrome c biogenesis protein [Vogesella sp. LIG4]